MFAKRVVSFLLVCMLWLVAVAQKLTVSSCVMDATTGERLPYVNVYAMKGGVGTLTNHEGEFTIQVDANDELRITFIGYEKCVIKASAVPATIAMKPWASEMREVQVDGNEIVLVHASEKLKKEVRRHSSTRAQYFFRILTTHQSMDQTEAFVSACSVGNLRDVEILKGRQTCHKPKEFNPPSVEKMNFHHPLELGPWTENSDFWKKLITPLGANVSIDYLQKHYLIKCQTQKDEDGREYLRIHLAKKPQLTQSPILTGTLYLDKESLALLNFDGQVEDMWMSRTSFMYTNTAPATMRVHINYRHTRGFTEVKDMATLTHCGDLKMQSVLFNVDDIKLKFKQPYTESRKSVDENLLNSIDDAGFDQAMWENSNIVKRTDEEQKALELKSAPANTTSITLLDVPITPKEYNCIESLGKNADKRLKRHLLRLARFAVSVPHEKVFIHMDNTSYCQGDTIWFAGYVRSALEDRVCGVSKVLYVELLNQEGYLVERKLIKLENGRGNGFFSLNKKAYAGFYELRAYTRWQLNWGVTEHPHSEATRGWFLNDELYHNFYRDYDKLYSRVFPVYDAKEGGRFDREMTLRPFLDEKTAQAHNVSENRKLTLTLYPEGGSLVAGLRTRVAYEAVWDDGEQAQLEGHPWRGSIEVTPVAGQEQEISFQDIHNNKVTARLPKPEREGVSLRARQDDDTWHFDLQLSAGIHPDSIGVSVMHEGNLQCVFPLTKRSQMLDVPKAKLPEGVNQITVFDVQGRVLADRLFFNTVPSGSAFQTVSVSLADSESISVKQANFSPYAPIRLKVKSLPNSILSLSVRDAELSDTLYDNSSMRTEMLLASEIKGFVPNPQYYFERDDEEHREALDLLLMIQGWRRFGWRDMAVANTWELTEACEESPVVFGVAYPNPDLPQDSAKMEGRRLMAYYELQRNVQTLERKHSFGKTPLRERVFMWALPSLNALAKLHVSVADVTGLDEYELQTYEFIKPYPLLPEKVRSYNRVDPPAFVARIRQPYPRFVKPYSYYQQHLMTTRQPVIKRQSTPAKLNASCATMILDAEDAWNYALDAGMRSDSPQDIGRAYVQTLGGKGDVTPVYCTEQGRIVSSVDNTQMADYEDKMRQAKFVLFTDFQPRQAALPGNDAASSNTQVATVLRDNEERVRIYRDRCMNCDTLALSAAFYHPDYSHRTANFNPKDYRRTLYWNPQLITNNRGQAIVEVYNNACQGRIQVSAEGISKKGVILGTE